MTRRRAAGVTWALLALYVAMQAVVVLLVVFRNGSPDELFSLVTVVYAVSGAVVATRRPGTPIGWMLLAVALAFALQALGEVYVGDLDNPGAPIVGWVSSLAWHIWVAVAAVFLPLVYPTGHLPSRRWRPVAFLLAAGVGFNIIVTALRPGDLGLSAPVDNPVGWRAPSGLFPLLETVAVTVSVVSIAIAMSAIVVRFRRSEQVERQQLKWFSLVALLGGAGIALAFLATVVPGSWRDPIGVAGWAAFLLTILVGMPVAVAIAVLRHRLYDIDLVINRTLVYGVLTASLVAAYLCSVLVFRVVLSPVTGESQLAVAGSTLAVAALFRPLRARIQGVVDRRFYRARYDAARTVESFSGRLREELDLEALGVDLRRVVRDTVQPAHVSLWLREEASR